MYKIFLLHFMQLALLHDILLWLCIEYIALYENKIFWI